MLFYFTSLFKTQHMLKSVGSHVNRMQSFIALKGNHVHLQNHSQIIFLSSRIYSNGCIIWQIGGEMASLEPTVP